MNITLGSDPELHVFDNEEKRIVSSLRVFKGRDKNKPINLGDGIKMYPDNVLLESAFPPASSIAEMMVRLKEVWVRMQEKLGSRYNLLPIAAHYYDYDQLRGKKPWEIGCNPSHDAYTEALNTNSPFSSGLRTGSFHIHIGCDFLKGMSKKRLAIRIMDIIVGCSSVIFDRDQTALARRVLYGRAGEFRPTPYGLEYRVLGNYPLSNPIVTELVWDLTMQAMIILESKNGSVAAEIADSVGLTHPQQAINTCDEGLALNVLRHADLPKDLLNRVLESRGYAQRSFNEAWGI
jgi:hypothetical protein